MSKYDIRQIFADMELDLIKSMKRNLARHEAEEQEKGFRWVQWQKRKLQALKEYRQRNRQIVEDRKPEIESGLRKTLRSAFRGGASSVADAAGKLWNKFGFGRREDMPRPIAGTPAPAPKPGQPPLSHKELPIAPQSSDDHFFKVNSKRLDALTEASKGELRAAQHAMLRQMDDVYRQTIFKAQVYHNSGAATLSKAIDMATQDFLDKGIDCITYSNGRKVNIASYAEMALRTASQRAVFTGQGAERDKLGIRTVVVSAHSNCSPLCLPWQGKVYVDDVYSNGTAADGDYPLLSTAMANGLFHPNCKHNMAMFVPGASKLPEPVEDDEALANYEAEQQQRYMERQIRKYKRREAGSVDQDNQDAAKAKVKEWQKRLREHIKANEHLRRDSRREKVRV